jgi:hypothetical protein
MKIKIIALIAFLIGFNNTANAYTREDLEKYRTINAIVSIVSIASAIDISKNGRDFNKPLHTVSSIPLIVDGLLSTALEKNHHILLEIVSLISAKIISDSYGINNDLRIIMAIVQIVLTYWLFNVIKQKYPLKEQETTRRKWRVFVRATLATIFDSLDERELQDIVFLFASRIGTFASTCLASAILEYIGSVIARNIQEDASAKPAAKPQLAKRLHGRTA